jgi:hypothetical protein
VCPAACGLVCSEVDLKGPRDSAGRKRMGNQNSSQQSSRPTSNPVSPSSSVPQSSHGQQKERLLHAHGQLAQHQPAGARRRESIPALPIKSLAGPSASLTLTHAESHLASTSTRPSSRGRAQSVATATSAAIANNLRATQENYKASAHDTASMGNEHSKGASKDKGGHGHGHGQHVPRDSTTPPQPLQPTSSTPERVQQQPQQTQQQTHQQQQPPPAAATTEPASEPAPAPAPALSPQTRPVDVPAVVREEPQSNRLDDLSASMDPASASQQEYIVSTSHFARPPRLPLPIEEETHLPGSPILSAHNYSSPIDHDEVEGNLPRHTSMLSTTTADDEDLGDEFRQPASGRPTVPTLIEWEGEGERVYATGTFAGWNRKYRLHRK